MTNDLKHAFGDRNNSEFVIAPDGEILVARSWSDPDQLRKDLEGFLGKADTFTEISDLDRSPKSAPTSSKITRGIVPRVTRPVGATPLASSPIRPDGEETAPFYVKLRAEAPRAFLESGKGQLYLGFHLDPIHHVHWNNLAAPLKYEITAPDGVSISDPIGQAPEVEEADADRDPREFLIEVDYGDIPTSEPLVLRVDYFACDDNDQFCKAISQSYEIELRADNDAGKVQQGRGRQTGGGNSRSKRPDPAQIMARMDRDQDGKISKEEATGPMKQRFAHMDTDEDGFVSEAEIKKRFESMSR